MPMHPMLPLVPLVAMIPIQTSQEGLQQTTQAEIVTLKAKQGRLTVPVRVIDKGPFEFLVDTGSENTVLSTGLAQELALIPKAKVTLISVAGRERVDTVEVDQLDLGKRSFYALTAPLLENRDIGAAGILGLDSLQGQRVLIDFKKQLMLVDDAKSLGGNRGFEIVVTARRRSGQLIMTNAKIDGVWTDVVIDTGAETTIGNRALQRALELRKGKMQQTVLHSVTGQQIVADLGHGAQLSIGDMNINNVEIAFADSPPFNALQLEERPAIFLGMRELRVFKRVAIDFASRKILFDLPGGFTNALSQERDEQVLRRHGGQSGF